MWGGMGIKLIFFLLIVFVFTLVGSMNFTDIQEIADGYSVATDVQGEMSEIAVPSHAGTYEDPVVVGEAARYTSSITSYYVSVDDFIRGDEANEIVLSGSEFNDMAPEGYEYFLANVSVKYVNGENSIILSDKDFRAFCEGSKCNYSYELLPDDIKKFSKGTIMSNGMKHGWLFYLVPQNETVIVEFKPVELPSEGCYISIGT